MGCGLSKARIRPEVLVSHRNARLTVHGRLLIVQRHQARLEAGAHRGGDGGLRKCVKTWIDRYAAEGEAGLQDRSSRPHTMPDADQPARSRQRVVELRRRERRGPDWIGVELGCRPGRCRGSCAGTRSRRWRECDPMTGELIRASKVTAVRYERDRPGELVHMDVKKLGRIPDGGGWRARGGTTAATTPHDRTRPRSATTTSTRWSTTTPGSPTPRSCPTRRARPAPAS